jgi:hypothetical protein
VARLLDPVTHFKERKSFEIGHNAGQEMRMAEQHKVHKRTLVSDILQSVPNDY